jgi:hypothetical protein
MLTKTNYIIWRDCKKNAWLKIHKPDIYFEHQLSAFEQSIIETGNEVELEARKLFPNGVLVEERGADALKITKELLGKKDPVIFQATFEVDGFFAAVDILELSSKNGRCSIVEIKATNDVDPKTHYHDLAFQYNLLKRAGLDIESANLLHLNSEYVREGKLNLKKLFVSENLTEKIEEMSADVLAEMQLAKDYLNAPDEPKGPCDCLRKGRSGHCTTFDYSNRDVPAYGVHDLARIGLSKRKLTELVDGNVFELKDIPESILDGLSDIQKNQIWTYLHNREIIDKEKIAEELEALVFPLYFLDYETFPAAIPRFDSFSPYNQIPFQYSLHILDKPDTEPRHVDFLFDNKTDPSRAFAESLQTNICAVGSVIVWHKDFECGRNRELAQRLPDTKKFFENIEGRIFDLETIFKKQFYVHKNFKGSSSIKKVLPVLIPSLKYDDLAIKEGGTAAEKWNQVVSGTLGDEEKALIIEALKTYCGLDTYAMYAIWKSLYDMVMS